MDLSEIYIQKYVFESHVIYLVPVYFCNFPPLTISVEKFTIYIPIRSIFCDALFW
jgi:hypothetical protein